MVDGRWNEFDQIMERDECPDCKNGTRAGLIERLESLDDDHGLQDASETARNILAIIADLRRMVES
jgi:hypothetical protein